MEKLHIDQNNKRYYWNLKHKDESIALNLQYTSQFYNNLPKLICFGWCNSKMVDDAPERQIQESVYPEAEKILQYLKSANETHREYFFENSFFPLILRLFLQEKWVKNQLFK